MIEDDLVEIRSEYKFRALPQNNEFGIMACFYCSNKLWNGGVVFGGWRKAQYEGRCKRFKRTMKRLRRFGDIWRFHHYSRRMIKGTVGSSDTSIPSLKTSTREEDHVLFSDSTSHSCVKAENCMRVQESFRNAGPFCVTMHTFWIVLTKYFFRMLFQAAHNSTWLFANLQQCLNHACSGVGQDRKTDFLSISEYTDHLSGKWHTVISSWKVS